MALDTPPPSSGNRRTRGLQFQQQFADENSPFEAGRGHAACILAGVSMVVPLARPTAKARD
jgi:hypothetical protein